MEHDDSVGFVDQRPFVYSLVRSYVHIYPCIHIHACTNKKQIYNICCYIYIPRNGGRLPRWLRRSSPSSVLTKLVVHIYIFACTHIHACADKNQIENHILLHISIIICYIYLPRSGARRLRLLRRFAPACVARTASSQVLSCS